MLTAVLAAPPPRLSGARPHAQFGSEPQAPPAPPPRRPPLRRRRPRRAGANACSRAAARRAEESARHHEGRPALDPGNIVYETGKAVIKPESEPTLIALKDFMDQNANFFAHPDRRPYRQRGQIGRQLEALAGQSHGPWSSGSPIMASTKIGSWRSASETRGRSKTTAPKTAGRKTAEPSFTWPKSKAERSSVAMRPAAARSWRPGAALPFNKK